jgi:hypothetical protein
MNKKNRGPQLIVWGGKPFWPLDPRPEDINIHTIAHALSYTCRYNGHCNRFYSVAEHSLILSELVTPKNAIYALLHDAAEAYVGDMVRPLKALLPEFNKIENKILSIILEKYGLGKKLPKEVTDVDGLIILDEMEALGLKHKDPQSTPFYLWNISSFIPPSSPSVIKEKFLKRFEDLYAHHLPF